MVADGEQVLLAAGAGLLDRGAGLGGPVDRDLEPAEHVADRRADRLGGPALAEQPLAALGGAGAGLALGAGGAQQRVGAAVQGPGPLLGGAQREPRVHLALAGDAGGLGELLAVGVSGSSSGASSAVASRASRSASPADASARASSAFAIAWVSRSASPRAARAWEPYWPSSSATAASVASDSCSLASATSTRLLRLEPLALEAGHVEAEPLGGGDRLGELLGGLVDRGLDLDQAGLARRAAGGEVGAEQVAVAGDRGDVGEVGDQRAGRRRGRRRRRP